MTLKAATLGPLHRFGINALFLRRQTVHAGVGLSQEAPFIEAIALCGSATTYRFSGF